MKRKYKTYLFLLFSLLIIFITGCDIISHISYEDFMKTNIIDESEGKTAEPTPKPRPTETPPVLSKKIQIITTSCPNGLTGSEYHFTLHAEGGSGEYLWSIETGILPDGLLIDFMTGEIFGTPETEGDFLFKIRAEDLDDLNNFDTSDFSITISSRLQIITQSLDNTPANEYYEQAFYATGGSSEYSWFIISGSLPQDVELDSVTGILSGYPSRPGNYLFAVQCEDKNDSNNKDTKSFMLTVTNLGWTIMVYLNGDSGGLSDIETYAFQDFNEMEASDLKGYGIKVIVLMDGIPGYYSGTSAFENTRLYEIVYDPKGVSTTTGIISRRLSSTELGLTENGIEELNMGDPQVASAFINFCKRTYTADNYSFILWGHGGSFSSATSQAKGTFENYRIMNTELSLSENNPTKPVINRSDTVRFVCTDDTSGDILYTQEIGTALQNKGINIAGFDLCYGAMIEIAYEIKDYADYMIASEDVEDADGWEYDIMFDLFKSTTKTPDDFYTSVIDMYSQRYVNKSGATISVIDLSLVDALMMCLNGFSDAIYKNCITNDERDSINTIIFDTVEDFYSSPGDFNIDIYDLADRISTEKNYANFEAESLKSAVSAAIPGEWHNNSDSGNPDAHGLALHFIPLDEDGFPASSHHEAYDKSYNGDYPLKFAGDSDWVIDSSIPSGLLYRLWYEILPY